MLHQIEPHVFDNTFYNRKPKWGDFLFIYFEETTVITKRKGIWEIPVYCELFQKAEMDYIYLFSLDQINCFLCIPKREEKWNFLLREKEYELCKTNDLRDKISKEKYFVYMTAAHINRWLKDNKYCGKCRGRMEPSSVERALICTNCQHTIYPSIPPAAIVAIINEDKIFLARGKHYGAGFFSLIAGYTEVGESLEQTAAREVMEETGLKIKDITYYSSQPWPMSGSLMVGFSARLDGSDIPHINQEELAEAGWFTRENIPEHPVGFSIAAKMIKAFCNGELK